MPHRNAVVAGLLALQAFATQPTAAQTAAPPPPELADKLGLCASCHGADGLPTVEKVPIIHGQHAFYLLTQLRDFRAGRRASDIMAPIAKDLSDDQMKGLTTYFSAQAWPNFHQAASDVDVTRSERLAVEGQCSQCHLNGFLGDSRNPRVSDQKPDYLQQTLTDLRGNVRQNAAAMAAIVQGWSDDDIAAMSRYLAGL
jgi:cytochrome c553